MAKSTVVPSGFFFQGLDLSGDIGAVNTIAGGPNVMDITGIDKSAIERVPLLRSGEISFNSWFNPSASQSHPTFSALPTSDVNVMVALPLVALGDAAACLVGKQVDYNENRQQDGSVVFTTQVLSNAYGVEWGQLLTAGKRSDSSGTNPTSGLDDLAGSPTSTDFGATMYAQVFSFSGTSITFTLRDAATEPTYAAVTGGASSAINAVGGYRWSTSSTQNIRRFLTIGTSGTFSQCTFAVAVVRHRVAVI